MPLRYGIGILRDEDDPELPVFEFDPAKSDANRAKHGIDFVAAQALWLDDRLLEVPSRFTPEPRFLVVGRIGRRYWSAVVTYRGACIRLISVRRARFEEVLAYDRRRV